MNRPNYNTMAGDEESPSEILKEETTESTCRETFALKRKASVAVCIYAAAIAGTATIFAYRNLSGNNNGSVASKKATTNVMDFHTQAQADFPRMNAQVEAMLSKKDVKDRKLEKAETYDLSGT